MALLVAAAFLLPGCATAPRQEHGARPFVFAGDTFAFANELVWEYAFDDSGRWTHERREPKPDYAHHCFVVARSARQFWRHAVFDPEQPPADEATYTRLIRAVVSTNPRRPGSAGIVFPGYADLREFSVEHEDLLKKQMGGAWQSYLQRGNWRMIFPFTRRHQGRMAEELVAAIETDGPAIAHLVRFPSLTINHALVLFEAEADGDEIRFNAYDPNSPDAPEVLKFSRENRTFYLSRNRYFAGGRVDVYRIYHRCCY